MQLHAHGPDGHARDQPEVAEVVRRWGQAYRQAHHLSPEQARVLEDLASCRTAALGGHLEICQDCGYSRPAFNSCRNRHCPKCQNLSQARWVEARQARILPTHYFHVVFTLPAPLRPVALRNREQIFNLLLASAANTLLELGRDPKRLGAQLGITAVLHTWSRSLHWHPHAHCIVTGGGLDICNDQWIPARRKFLFPVKVMGSLFRGKMLAGLGEAIDRGDVDLGGIDRWSLFDTLYRTSWVVYAKRPFGGAEQVVRYLGQYTHRVGISNRRLVSIDERGICFRTKDGKQVTVAPLEFLRRFLLHVLPEGFVKIRHYGLLASGNVATRLVRAGALLAAPAVRAPDTAPAPKTWAELLLALTGLDVALCPRCQNRTMTRVPLLQPLVSPTPRDTS